MPITYGDFNYAWGDDLREEHCKSKARKIYPFDGDTSNYTLEEDYNVFIEYYLPPAPSAQHPDFANVFFIKDTPIVDIGNGLGSYTRTWSTLPGMTSDGRLKKYVRSEHQSHVATIPGIGTAQTGFQDRGVASVVISGGKHIITTTTPHGIAAGKLVAIKYTVYDPLDRSTRVGMVQNKVALPGTTGTTLIVDQVTDVNTINITAVSRSGLQTPSRQRVVDSKVEYTYWLVGKNVESEEKIPIIQQFEIVDFTTGGVVDYLTETTTPTIDDYLQYVKDGRWYCAEATTLQQWQGEIIEAKTRYCRYQL